jgi:hypothetical protein
MGPGIASQMQGLDTAQRTVIKRGGVRDLLGDPEVQARATDVASNLDFTGTFGGVKSVKAPTGLLPEAKRLTREGLPPEDIWTKTGWFQGPDQKWRWEIDDSAAAVNYPADKWGFNRGGEYPQTVGDFLGHPELYEAYPPAGQINFSQKAPHASMAGERGSFAPAEGKVPPRLTLSTTDPEQARSTTLHELQHYLQDVEGFAQGGDPRTAADTVEKYLATIANRMKRAEGPEKAQLARRYEELSRLKLTGGPHELYRRLAGEAEARLVQKRADYTPETRRAWYPGWDYDVPPEQQIVRGVR